MNGIGVSVSLSLGYLDNDGGGGRTEFGPGSDDESHAVTGDEDEITDFINTINYLNPYIIILYKMV